MKDIPVAKPGDRARRIELVAAAAFGRNPETGQAEKGWQAKLARAMGLGKSTITSTLDLDRGENFDRKLADFVTRLRQQMAEDIEMLVIIEAVLRSPETRAAGFNYIDKDVDSSS